MRYCNDYEERISLSDRDIENARNVPIEDVLNAVGIIPTSRGYFSCPDPDHKDNNPSCHIYRKINRCKCFSCGRSFGPIDIIMARENRTFPDAVIRVLEIGGIRAEGKAKEKPGFRLPTKKEMEILGIHTNPVYVTVNITDVKPDKERYITEPENEFTGNPGGYIIMKPADYNPTAFFAENPDEAYMLIRGKALEKYRHYDALKGMIQNGDADSLFANMVLWEEPGLMEMLQAALLSNDDNGAPEIFDAVVNDMKGKMLDWIYERQSELIDIMKAYEDKPKVA